MGQQTQREKELKDFSFQMSDTKINRLKAGAAVIDITPPLSVGLLTSSTRGEWAPFHSERTPLKARALVLESGGQWFAFVSLDLLGLQSVTVGGWRRFKRALAEGTSHLFHPDNIVITCTHTHNAPESTGITNLYQTPHYRSWFKKVRRNISQVLLDGRANARECRVSLAEGELNNFSLNRRIPSDAGIVMSDSVQPIAPKLFLRKPIDRRVRTVQFSGLDGSSIATMVHAICHPVNEMCLPHIGWDFPGEMCRALEEQSGFGTVLFLNGAAGDVNPPTVSEGPTAAALHGEALAKAVTLSIPQGQGVKDGEILFHRRTLNLPIRSAKGRPLLRTCPAYLSALRLGDLAIVFVPGEIFSETGLKIEKASPFRNTIVVGFAESSIGYVPPKQAFQEGGYEIGPGKWSFLQEQAESILRTEIDSLLKKLGTTSKDSSFNKSKISFYKTRQDLRIPA
jgi:neutral ceramidase